MYVLLYGAIQKLPTALTGALSFIYPVAAILVDWLVFEHRLSLAQWLGVAAIPPPRRACSRLERAPAEAGGASRLRRGEEKPRDEAGLFYGDLGRSVAEDLEAFAFGDEGFLARRSGAMAPKGICARSFQLSGRFQVLWVCASTSGL